MVDRKPKQRMPENYDSRQQAHNRSQQGIYHQASAGTGSRRGTGTQRGTGTLKGTGTQSRVWQQNGTGTRQGNRSRTSPQKGTRSAARTRSPQRRKTGPTVPWGCAIVILVVFIASLALGIFLYNIFFANDAAGDATVAQSVSDPLVSDEDKAGFDESINSDSAILINADNGDVLYEKDADTQRAPASLVKMMTVYVAIRNNDDLDRELKMPEAAFEGLEEEQASQSGLVEGETVTIRDLLYAALLKSGGDAANALALATSGNIESFVELMNDEAQALGMDSTVYVNATGLDDAEQLSTCRDMARFVKGALGNTTFREVFTTREYTTTANDTHTEGLILTHTMDDDLNTFQRYFDTSGYEIIGGKTGYTTAAGNCLASLAEKNGEPSYIVVTMHATGNSDQYYQAMHDAVTLYGEAYNR